MSQRITLEQPRAAGYPVVKRIMLGETFNGAILRAESRDRLKRADDGSMQPMLKPNGNPRQELVVTCLTLPGTTSSVGLGEDEYVPEPGTIVRLILKGKAFGDWIEEKRSLPDGAVAVGDVVTQTTVTALAYDAHGNASGGEMTDQTMVDTARSKGRSVGIYGPLTLREGEAGDEWAEKAVAAYKALETGSSRVPVDEYDDYGDTDDNAAAVSANDSPALPPGMTPEVWATLSKEAQTALQGLRRK